MRQFCQLVAANNQAQAITAFSYPLVLPLVHERVVRSAAGSKFFGGFNELVSSEIDLPFIRRRFLGDTAGPFNWGVFAPFFVWRLFNETILVAFCRGCEPAFL